jgi:hypothetical protein
VRGSPLLRALVAFLVLLALGAPLWRLTQPAGVPVAAPVAEAKTEAQPVRLRLTFSHVPKSMRVLHLGEEVWTESAPAAEVEREFRLPFPREGIELQFDIAWPEEGLAAMRAQLTTPDGTELEKSIWGRGSVSEVAAFP